MMYFHTPRRAVPVQEPGPRRQAPASDSEDDDDDNSHEYEPTDDDDDEVPMGTDVRPTRESLTPQSKLADIKS